MDREAFDRKYAARLNRQQQEAVHAVEGPVLLLAVPGSGKTTVLVTRLGYMLCCCGIAPDQILTMTYTRAAAGEMKQRFAALFGQDCPHPPEIRTINGVSSKIIAYYAQNCGKRPPFILAEDESALAKLVSDLYRDLCGEYPHPERGEGAAQEHRLCQKYDAAGGAAGGAGHRLREIPGAVPGIRQGPAGQ